MEKAVINWELEEEEALEIEDLQVRQSLQLPTKRIEDGDMNNLDVDRGVDDDLVHAPPEEILSSDNGGLEVSQGELREEEVDPKSSERFVYYQHDEGTGFTGGKFSIGQSSIMHTGQDEIHCDRSLDVTKESLDIGQHFSQESKLEHEKQLKHNSLSSSNLLLSEISPEDDSKNSEFSSYNKEIGSGDTSLLHESGREATEFDVERVLSKQDTHDLYCPNCKSCITRRVIIRKRKRILPYSDEDSKRNKLEEGTGSDPISTLVETTINPSPRTVDTCLDGSAAPTSDNYDQDQEPDVFRCLSCFSIFIPAGDGFKLLRMSGDRKNKENLQHHQQISIVKKSWFSNLFKSNRNVDNGVGDMADVETDDTEVGVGDMADVETDDTEVGVGDMADVETDDTEVLIPSHSTRENGKVSAVHESSSHAQTDLGGELVKTGAQGSTEGGTNELPHQEIGLGIPQEIATSHANYAEGETVQSEITGSKEGGNKVLSSSSKRFTEQDIHLVSSGELSVGDAIIVETCQVEPLATQSVQDLTNPAETGNLQYLETRIQINEQTHTSTEGIQGVEIIKSIVYGGLVESISSLGVVSSAAGSYVTTLNIFALGLANLIGGLFILGHNLSELKNDQKTEASSDQSAEKVDHYHELLGQRKNFLLHAVFAILSYLIFGLLPPVVYGFSFQKSDDRDLKLVAVAAVSLLGIIILAAGKAYVQKAPRSYVKTVGYYVVTALMASGISYAAGDLINFFLEKYGAFQSNLVVTLPETLVTEPAAWASY